METEAQGGEMLNKLAKHFVRLTVVVIYGLSASGVCFKKPIADLGDEFKRKVMLEDTLRDCFKKSDKRK